MAGLANAGQTVYPSASYFGRLGARAIFCEGDMTHDRDLLTVLVPFKNRYSYVRRFIDYANLAPYLEPRKRE